MDIPGLSMAMSMSRVKEEWGTAMLAKSLDEMDASSDAMVDMMKETMELSVNPNLGGSVNVSL